MYENNEEATTFRGSELRPALSLQGIAGHYLVRKWFCLSSSAASTRRRAELANDTGADMLGCVSGIYKNMLLYVKTGGSVGQGHCAPLLLGYTGSACYTSQPFMVPCSYNSISWMLSFCADISIERTPIGAHALKCRHEHQCSVLLTDSGALTLFLDLGSHSPRWLKTWRS